MRLLAICALVFLLVATTHANAQVSKIFLSSGGSDAADGGRLTPKRSLQAAHDAIAAGGTIVILDTAGYGALVVTKSLNVTVPPGVNGFVTVTGNANGVFVNAGATDTVSLRGLIIEGGGTATNGGAGLLSFRSGALIVEDCLIRNFYNGVLVDAPNTSRLIVRGGAVKNVQYGYSVQSTTAGVVLTAVLEGVTVNNASVRAISTFGSNGATTSMAVRDCMVVRSGNGLRVSGSTIVAEGCTLDGNTYAFFKTNNSGTIISRGTNTLINNANKINAPNTVTVQAGE